MSRCRFPAARCAWPIRSAPFARPIGKSLSDLLEASALAVLLALLLAFAATQSIGRRLLRITDFAERVAAGDLSARIQEESTRRDCARSLCARQDSAQAGRRIPRGGKQPADSGDAAELHAGGGHRRLAGRARAVGQPAHGASAAQRIRLGAPLVQSVRDPEILASVNNAVTTRDVTMARAAKIFSGRIFDVTAAPMPGGGAVAVLHDQTEIERVEKTRRDFIANVSHELRTPLTSVQGYAETLLDSRSLPENLREFVEIIRKNAIAHVAADGRPAGAGARGIGRAETSTSRSPCRRNCWKTRCRHSRRSPPAAVSNSR